MTQRGHYGCVLSLTRVSDSQRPGPHLRPQPADSTFLYLAAIFCSAASFRLDLPPAESHYQLRNGSGADPPSRDVVRNAAITSRVHVTQADVLGNKNSLG